MKRYKLVEAKNEAEAEQVMNAMATEGWRVVSVCEKSSVHTMKLNYVFSLLITLERDEQ